MILGYSRGFIQKLSPIRRSRSVKTDWFEFNLQTSPTKKRRVIGFNTLVNTELKELAESKSAVVLTNTKDNDAGDIIFSQRSSARPTPNSNIDFDYTVLEEADGDGSSSSCEISTKISVTVDQIPTLRPNQRVSLVGTISLGSETPMEIKF